MDLDITPEQVATREQVGRIAGDPVFALGLKGGLHMVVRVKKTARKTETLGAGPHPAVARFIAEKEHPSLVLEKSLRKSETDRSVMAEVQVGRAWTAELRRRGI